MSEFVFYIVYIFVILFFLGVISSVQRAIKKSEEKPKEFFCVLFRKNFYNIPKGSNEEDCVMLMGTPSDVYTDNGFTVMEYHEDKNEKGVRRIVRLYFKNSILNHFATFNGYGKEDKL